MVHLGVPFGQFLTLHTHHRSLKPLHGVADRLGGEVEERLEKAVQAERDEADDDPDKLLDLLKAEIRAEAGDIVTEPIETGDWA